MDRLERILRCLRSVERSIEDDHIDSGELDVINSDITKIVKEW